MIDVVTGLAVRCDGHVLMAQRLTTSPGPGMWEYPGGKVEDGETHEDALVREWNEELGVEAQVLRAVDSPLVLQLERTYRIYLMTLTIRGEPRPLASQQIRWVEPCWAITSLPMVPSTYWFYPAVLRVLRA